MQPDLSWPYASPQSLHTSLHVHMYIHKHPVSKHTKARQIEKKMPLSLLTDICHSFTVIYAHYRIYRKVEKEIKSTCIHTNSGCLQMYFSPNRTQIVHAIYKPLHFVPFPQQSGLILETCSKNIKIARSVLPGALGSMICNFYGLFIIRCLC